MQRPSSVGEFKPALEDPMDINNCSEGNKLPVKEKSYKENIHGSLKNLVLLKVMEEENRKIAEDERSPLKIWPRTEEPAAPTDRSQEEEELWKQWANLLKNWSVESKKKTVLRDLVRRGIPNHFRGIAWQLLAGPDLYAEKSAYADYIRANSACEKIISRDVGRTFPEHAYFKEKGGSGQEALFNVMKAYSVHDLEVGYCQGSAFIVGLLLMHMPEEEAFAVLTRIMNKHCMRDMFKPTMEGLSVAMHQLDRLVAQDYPEIDAHFKAQTFHTSILASRWFLTLFASCFPPHVASRIMDIFLFEGITAIFQLSLAMLQLALPKLLFLDMEGIQKYYKEELYKQIEEDPEKLFEAAFKININLKTMKKLEKEYTTGKQEKALAEQKLRCYKQENSFLQERVLSLEKECHNLAQRLVAGQVDRAHSLEEMFNLTQQLETTQNRLVDEQNQKMSLQSMLEERKFNNGNEEVSESGGSGDLTDTLQRELVRARLEIAEREASERELRTRLAEMEGDMKTLRNQHVDNSVAHLQEELITVKMREAEMNLTLKKMRQKYVDLSEEFQRFQQSKNRPERLSPTPTSKLDVMSTPKKLLRSWGASGSLTQRQVEDELMGSRLREAEADAERNELRHRVMELEAALSVSSNQVRRLDQEREQLSQALEEAQRRERQLLVQARHAERKYADLESMTKCENVQVHIQKLEDAQRIAELQTQVSEYKIQTEVLATEGELRTNSIESEDVGQLQERVAELRAEVKRLEAFKARVLGQRLGDAASLNIDYSAGDGDDDSNASNSGETSPATLKTGDH